MSAEIRRWLEDQKTDPDAIKAPPKTMRYLIGEAAAYFGIPMDELMRKPVERRAEMMAHVMLKDARDNFMEWKKSEKMKAKEKAKTHMNPAEAQRKRWGLS